MSTAFHTAMATPHNLGGDIGEQRNLVLDYSEVVEKLKSAVREHKRDIEENSRPLGVVDKL